MDATRVLAYPPLRLIGSEKIRDPGAAIMSSDFEPHPKLDCPFER
jgi:hypothetical protein